MKINLIVFFWRPFDNWTDILVVRQVIFFFTKVSVLSLLSIFFWNKLGPSLTTKTCALKVCLAVRISIGLHKSSWQTGFHKEYAKIMSKRVNKRVWNRAFKNVKKLVWLYSPKGVWVHETMCVNFAWIFDYSANKPIKTNFLFNLFLSGY